MARVDVKGLAQAARERMARARPAGAAPASPLVPAGQSPFADPPPAAEPPAEAEAGAPRARLAAVLSRLRRPGPAAAAETAAGTAPAGDRRRALMRTTALVVLSAAVIASAGQFVQTGAEARRAAATPAEAPRDIVALSAGAQPDLPPTARILPMPEPTDLTAASEVTVTHAPPVPVAEEDILLAAGDPVTPPAPLLPLPETPAPRPPASTLPVPGGAPATIGMAPADACPTQLSVTAAGQGLLLIRFEAPCAAHSAAVLRHGPLSVSARLDAEGTLDLALPALEAAGEVVLRLADERMFDAAAPVDLSALRRVALQWQGQDALELHAFEGGATDYAGPGHISAENPGLSAATGLPAAGGWLVRLGDEGVALPQFADIYTFPADPALPVRLTVEVPVTAATCGAEVLAEAVTAVTGAPRVDEITLAMPGCEAQGDYVVLNYPAGGTKLAAASD